MNVIAIIISILVFVFSVLFFISLKTSNIGMKGRDFIKTVFIKNNQKKPDFKKFQIYFNDFSNFQFFGIKVNSLEKLYFIKIFFSFSVFVLINFTGFYLKNNYFCILRPYPDMISETSGQHNGIIRTP